MEVKSKTRKRLAKQVRKLIKRHGEAATSKYLAALVDGIVHRDIPLPSEDAQPVRTAVKATSSNSDPHLQPGPEAKATF